MKLITRTNLFLVSLVFFQAFLAYNFLTISLVNFSQKDGYKTIENDLITIRNHYRQFKDQFWRDLIHVDNKWAEGQTKINLDNPDEALPYLMSMIHSDKLDYLIIKNGEKRVGINIRHPFTEFPYEEIPFFEAKWHPTVFNYRSGQSLFMIGTLQLSPGLRVNIIKELNDQFSKDLSYNISAGIILYTGDSAISGTLDPDYYFEKIVQLESLTKASVVDEPFYDIPLYGKSYNIYLSRFDTLIDKETEIKLALFSPNLSMKQRFTSIKNQFLLISIFCVALAMFISLFISKSISKPVQVLGQSMTSLKNGYFPKVKPVNKATEINILFNDFNCMVERIKYNSSQQIALIQEITFLKTYNEQIVESIQEGIAIVDATGHLNLMNRAFYDFCPAIKDMEIPHVREIPFWNEHLEENLNLVKRKDIQNFAYISRNDDGQLIDIRLYPLRNTGYDRATENSCVLMLEDITVKDQVESQLLQLEKLNSLSILTAGVAHEINNPLASIMSNVENLHIDENDLESQTSVTWIKKEIRRIANIIKGLFDFTGSNQKGQTEGLLTSTWPSRVSHYMKYVLKNNPDIQFSIITPELDTNSVIPDDEILQILINIINNAVQALEHQGRIELITEGRQIDDESFLVIKIVDDGPGIQPENIKRIFDPFFTTKPVGKGTGLGLSIVYGLVNNYGGSVNVESSPGKGCTFSLIIPRERRCEG
ncbi:MULTISPECIES: ATP-binding protein [unclassified Oceanispirochaeta]|uniref:sensor histidine kinase n=1 Tax=unclassified Oceanispirochaeta TaxID=2635722 RepID=UPI000E0922F8|nr:MULTISPECIES: ATP-binding protein [unclassified Oceanispirochaeta]MBF9014628.1 GHKL domain-containing protein [Oceanispirochaeta sp. M2]NPD70884.1 GHKL domain-containing protein [Oceanispirochaeta sp. M1]RDG34163.1 HAMP domain-containing protein [Oceanispirochaeta sp. M1]